MQNTRKSVKEVLLEKQERKDLDEDSEDEGDESPVSVTDFYTRFVERSSSQIQDELSAPQRSDAWKQARAYCLTASNFGAAAGNNPYQSPEALLKEKLWGAFQGNFATAYGTAHEDDARHETEVFMQETYGPTTFHYPNLMKHERMPWLAVSPDGIAETPSGTVLLEFKCPLKDTDGHPYNKHKYCMPPYYFDQVQGILGFYNTVLEKPISEALFVVWQPHQTWITRVPYDQTYWESLFPKLHTWYFEKYLPALVHKHNKTIVDGEVTPSAPVNV